MFVPEDVVRAWSDELFDVVSSFSRKSDELCFLSADVSPVVLRWFKDFNPSIKIRGVVRGYFWVNDGSRGSAAALKRVLRSRNFAELRFLPLLHSKVLIFNYSRGSKVIVGSGNLTKRSFREELNHFLVVSDSQIVSKFIEDFSKIWSAASVDHVYEECSSISLRSFDAAGLNQFLVGELVNKYLGGKVRLTNVLSRLNLSLPFYQWLFLFMVAEEMYIFSYLIEFEAAKRLIVPAAVNDVKIRIVASNRVSRGLVDMINNEISYRGGLERVKIKILNGIHAKTAVVKDKRGRWLVYIGSAALTRSALFSEINHGVIVADRELAMRLLDDFNECESI